MALDSPDNSASARRSPPSAQRSTIIWQRKFDILVVALPLAVALAVAATYLPPKYSASATVRVSASSPSPGVSPRDVVQASNDLASQYVHLVDVPQVISKARVAEGLADAKFSVNASTVAAQNLISISVQSDNAAQAAAASRAVASAFVTYVQSTSDDQARKANAQLQTFASGLSQQVEAAQKDVAAAAAAPQGSSAAEGLDQRLQLLSTLQARQLDAQQQLAATGSGVAQFEVVSSSGATKISPRPVLYGAVSLVVIALIMAEVVVRRSNRQR